MVLATSLVVSASSEPITHTYLISNDGEYVFEVVIPPTSSGMIIYKPIIAMYDSKNALCGLNILDEMHVTNQYKATSFRIEVTPSKTPKTIKLMLWSSNIYEELTPLTQYELVSDTLCNQDFGTIANLQLTKIKSKQYTYEAIFKSSANATYTPIFRMYDASGNICGFYKGEAITLTAGKRELKEFTITSTSTPANIYFTLEKGTEISQFSELPTAVSTQKFGMIMSADSSKGVKIYATDGSYQYYQFADNFVLSYGNTLVTNKQTAYNHLNTLRLKSYNRYADDYKNATDKNYVWSPTYDWLLFFSDSDRYGSIIPNQYLPYMLSDEARMDYADFLNNYSKRMVTVSISPDGKINSMAFPGDSFFARITAGKKYNEVFYDKPNTTFSNKLPINSNAKILYLPTKKGATESDFKLLSPSELKDGNAYYIADYTTSTNEQIIILTYMLSDSEIASRNKETVKNINLALNGNGSTAPGIKSTMFDISINTQKPDINDQANALANTAMSYVAKGLEGALKDAELGYHITKDFISVKYSTEVDAAKQAIKELQEMDTKYKTTYFNNLKNELLDVVETSALNFLEDVFINN